MSAPAEAGGDDLVGDLIAEVARTHGIAISRDDPVIAVVLLNQLVLRRYLEAAVAPATAAIHDATREAVAEIEQLAQAQAHWLEQVSLKDRAMFLEEQKTLHAAWKADIAAMIEGQNRALREVVIQTAGLLRAQRPIMGPRPMTETSQQEVVSLGKPGRVIPWCWISSGVLMGAGITATLVALTWRQLAGQ